MCVLQVWNARATNPTIDRCVCLEPMVIASQEDCKAPIQLLYVYIYDCGAQQIFHQVKNGVDRSLQPENGTSPSSKDSCISKRISGTILQR